MAGTGKAHLRDAASAIVRVEDLVVEFPIAHGKLKHLSSRCVTHVLRYVFF